MSRIYKQAFYLRHTHMAQIKGTTKNERMIILSKTTMWYHFIPILIKILRSLTWISTAGKCLDQQGLSGTAEGSGKW